MINSCKLIFFTVLGTIFLFSCSSDDPSPITKGVVLNDYGSVKAMSIEKNDNIILAANGGLYRLSSAGNVIWEKEYNYGVDAAITLGNSDIITVESIYDNPGFETWQIRRVSFSTGQTSWLTEIVSESDTSLLRVPTLFITDDDQIMLVSTLSQSPPGMGLRSSHLHMVKFDFNGMQMGNETLMELENPLTFLVNLILVEDTNNLIVQGRNTFETKPIVLQKYSNQNHIWTSQFGEQVFYEITKMKKLNGNYVLVGTRQTTASLLVVNESGGLVTEKYIGEGQFKHWFYDIILDSKGRYVACGFNNNNAAVVADAWVVTMDQDGEVLNEQIFGGETDDSFFAILRFNNRFIASGWQVTDNDGFYDYNNWVLKFN